MILNHSNQNFAACQYNFVLWANVMPPGPTDFQLLLNPMCQRWPSHSVGLTLPGLLYVSYIRHVHTSQPNHKLSDEWKFDNIPFYLVDAFNQLSIETGCFTTPEYS